MNWKIARRIHCKKLDREEKKCIKRSWSEALKELKDRYINGNGIFLYSETSHLLPDLLAEKIKKVLKRKRINFTFEKKQYSYLGNFYYVFRFEQE